MAQSQAYVSVKRILERVYSDYDLPKLYTDEVKEWVFDALSLISVTKLMYDDYAEITIENGRGKLPANFFGLNPAGLREKSTGIVLLSHRGSFGSSVTGVSGRSITYVAGSSIVYDQNGDLVESDQVSFLTTLGEGTEEMYTYRLTDGWVFCNISQTTLEISYKAIPVDEENSPLVPDDTKIINAIVASVAYRLAKRLMIREELTPRAYDIIEKDALFNMASARSANKVLAMHEMESFKNRFLRLMPDVTAYYDSFDTFGNPEQLNTEFN